MIQLNVANELACAIYVTTTPGWAARQIKTTVIKEPALVQLLKLVILIEAVMEKYSEYMFVGKQIDRHYTVVMWLCFIMNMVANMSLFKERILEMIQV